MRKTPAVFWPHMDDVRKKLSAAFGYRRQYFLSAQILSSVQLSYIGRTTGENNFVSEWNLMVEKVWVVINHPTDISHTSYMMFCTVCLSKGGGGKFLYIHSATQRVGDIAKVTTRSPFPASIGLCHLRFWFYMHGSDKMGTLKVI